MWLTDSHLLVAVDDIRKKLDLDSNMAKVHQAMNILAKFGKWHWLLSIYRRKAGGLPPTGDIERWKLHSLNSDDLPDEREESSTELSRKRMIAPKLLKDEAATSRARVVSPFRKKLRLPFAVSLLRRRFRLPGSSTL